MKKLFIFIIILILLSIVFPVFIKNPEFNKDMQVVWTYIQDFSNWAIKEIQKLIKLISNR